MTRRFQAEGVGGGLAYETVYFLLYHAGLTPVSHPVASGRVGQMLFGGGIFETTLLFQFLNPFYEELIVRAYLMTEIRFLTNSGSQAVMVSTLLQTCYHLYQGGAMAVADGATFLLFSLYYAKTKRILPVILAHLYMDGGTTLWYGLHHQ